MQGQAGLEEQRAALAAQLQAKDLELQTPRSLLQVQFLALCLHM